MRAALSISRPGITSSSPMPIPLPMTKGYTRKVGRSVLEEAVCQGCNGSAELFLVKVALHLIDEHAAHHQVRSRFGRPVVDAPIKRV